MKHVYSLLLATVLCTSCSYDQMYSNTFVKDAQVTQTTKAGAILEALPKPAQPVPVVVYEFQDQTGQFKSNDNFGEYSSAVTKGGLAVLVESLLDTSDGKFFMVAERGGLNNLLKERQIIRTMRTEYTRPDGSRLPDIPPMVYGGMILEGGIIFYDSNILTGGAAAGYFGISGSTQYRRDIVTVYLRAVEVQTGKVIAAVNSSKTIFSYGVSASVLRYLAIDKLLEAETGFSVNEPAQLAVRQAIETAVYSLVMEGAMRDLWSFGDKEAGQKAIAAYLERRDRGNENKARMPYETSAAGGNEQAVASSDSVVRKKPVKECNGFDAWMKRNFGSNNVEPERIVEKQPMQLAQANMRRVPPPLANNQLPTKTN